MKALLLFMCAAVSATLVAETAEPPSRWRINLAGVGRLGSETSLIDTPLNKQHDLYGGSFDLHFNLLPGENFNLWLGLGSTYMPEQEVASYALVEGISVYTITFDDRVKMEACDVHVMLLPEWRLTDTVALGLRFGVGVCRYNGSVSESTELTDTTLGETIAIESRGETSQTLFRTLLGAQLLWQLSDQLSALAYGQAYFGESAKLEMDGVKIGEFDDLSAEIGIGLTYTF